jgi:hypothetical protein
MDIISFIIGFVIGLVVLGVAIELGTKKKPDISPTSKHTKNWNISEINNPRIMAEHLGDIDIPKNSKVLVNFYKNKENLEGLNVKEHESVKGNFIVGDDRALILSGPMKKDELGFWTIEKEIIEKLSEEFDQTWEKGIKIN